MRRLLSEENDLILENEVADMRGIRPVLNGDVLDPVEVTAFKDTPDQLLLHYSAPALKNGRFVLELIGPDQNGRLWLRYWLEGLPEELVLDSFGLKVGTLDNLLAFLRQGYTSWDGSEYVRPDGMGDDAEEERHSETGHAMTQILPQNRRGCLIIGFERHDRYQQTFTFETRRRPCSLTIQTWWDRKDRDGLQRCVSERLVLFTHERVEEGLREWARIVAAASPVAPRVPDEPINGWCSWYNLYANITEEIILDHLHDTAATVRREQLPMRIFQIDDGFTPEMGDWLTVKPQFPRGMRPLLDDIRSAGFIPGLWIAPFMVGNRSQLYQAHPDWVVQDRVTGGPLVQMRFYAEFRWHKRSEEYYILDTTHPKAFAYLRQVFRTWRQEWGCGYFKTDFMHFGSDHGPDRARWHTPGMTRIENWRRVAEMIRDEIEDTLWLGCGSPLWVPVGLVDGMRISRDSGVAWQEGGSVRSLVRDLATRNFANNILWQSDPDCVLLRNRFHFLTDVEVRSLALYAGMSGGVMMTSDRLSEMSTERLQLWRLLLSKPQIGCDFPLLGLTDVINVRIPDEHEVSDEPQVVDPVTVQVRQPSSKNGVGAIFLFNLSKQTVRCSFDLGRLGISTPVFLVDWVKKQPLPEAVYRLSLALHGHDSTLLFFHQKDKWKDRVCPTSF